MQLNRFLDVALSSAAKVKVLRRLVLSSRPKSGRAIARDVALSHAQTGAILQELHQAGLVSFDSIGRSYVYSLRRQVFPVKEILIPLFERERDLLEDLAQEIVSSIQTSTLSVFIFGSVARSEDRPESDLDLAIVVRGKSEQLAVEDELAGEVSDLAGTLGVRLDYHVFTRSNFQQRYQAKDAFIREIVTAGRRVSGAYPTEVLSRGSTKSKHANR